MCSGLGGERKGEREGGAWCMAAAGRFFVGKAVVVTHTHIFADR